MTPATGDSFLLRWFRDFYREVLRSKRVLEGAAPPAHGEEAGGGTATVGQRLLAYLQRQSLAAARVGGDFAFGMYGEAQYVMAALADETFLHLDWSGSEGWSSNLLEERLFKTHRAGEEVFERIDQLLAKRDPFYLDLAQVYLMALALGFEGKYRGAPDGERRLGFYRRRLLEFLAEREPDLLDTSRDLVPEAYESTLDQERGRRLPYLRPWLVAGAAVLLLWLAVGHLLWNDLIADLDPLLDRILAR